MRQTKILGTTSELGMVNDYGSDDHKKHKAGVFREEEEWSASGTPKVRKH